MDFENIVCCITTLSNPEAKIDCSNFTILELPLEGEAIDEFELGELICSVEK